MDNLIVKKITVAKTIKVDKTVSIKKIAKKYINVNIQHVRMSDIHHISFTSNGNMYLVADAYWIRLMLTKDNIKNKYVDGQNKYIAVVYEGILKHQFSGNEYIRCSIDMTFANFHDYAFVANII